MLSEDHSTPIVHLQLWYHVGSKNERPGRTGFAHLFEHLMFKGSKNVEPEAHTSFISSVGGQSNAYTTEDATVFWETAPQQYLPLMLWLEADRMATLRVDEDTFKREREVVKEERRMRVENQPYGRLHGDHLRPGVHRASLQASGDRQHAGSRGGDDRGRARLLPHLLRADQRDDDDRRRLRPRPGDAVRAAVFRPRAEAGQSRCRATSRPSRRRRRRSASTLEEPWPLPAVVVAYHITYDGHPDSYPLHMASKILSDGQSSRIYASWCTRPRLALTAFGGGNIIEHPNLFYAVAIVQPGQSPADVEKALIAELDRMRTEPVSEHELQRAKNQFARDYIVGRETVQEKAAQLAHADVIHNDIKTADGEFDIFQGITAADIQRVAQTYFTPANRLVMTVMPKTQTQ